MPITAREIAAEIRRYCKERPNACDSIEGIVWWLVRQRYDGTLEQVRAAVDTLVARGELVPRQLSDGSIVFGCAKRTASKPSSRRKAH